MERVRMVLPVERVRLRLQPEPPKPKRRYKTRGFIYHERKRVVHARFGKVFIDRADRRFAGLLQSLGRTTPYSHDACLILHELVEHVRLREVGPTRQVGLAGGKTLGKKMLADIKEFG